MSTSPDHYMIADSSTLILLVKAGLLDGLLSRIKALAISSKVEQESTEAKGTFDTMIISRRIAEGRILVKAVKDSKFCIQLMEDFNIRHGEAEVITLCKEKKMCC